LSWPGVSASENLLAAAKKRFKSSCGAEASQIVGPSAADPSAVQLLAELSTNRAAHRLFPATRKPYHSHATPHGPGPKDRPEHSGFWTPHLAGQQPSVLAVSCRPTRTRIPN